MRASTDGRGRHRRIVLGRRWRPATVAAGLAYAVVASFTRPFTVAADVVTALPLAVAVLVMAWSIHHDSRSDPAQRASSDGGRPRWGRSWLVWVAPLLAAAAWELYCFASAPRADHPTVSTLIDILDSSRAGKTVAFAAWLGLGWFLVAR